jgi:hypothetical protein
MAAGGKLHTVAMISMQSTAQPLSLTRKELTWKDSVYLFPIDLPAMQTSGGDPRDTFTIGRAQTALRRVGLIEHIIEPSGVQAVYKIVVNIQRLGLDAHVDPDTGQ